MDTQNDSQSSQEKKTGWFPTLNSAEKEIINDEMHANAYVGPDFYLLILLASGIAYFGLQQNSSVVIIGAMLVAPLMSPMMAIGFAIIKGDMLLVGKAISSTLIGMGLAVIMAAVITFLFPFKTVTSEILARTNPNILDLFIAMISGMAGAYAQGRKEVSASLPGVAIAASLVPPLCVVGFGIGSADFGIAATAFLLFATNLASIVVAGIVMFWLLGFRPGAGVNPLALRSSVRFALFGVLIVSIPLIIFSYQDAVEARRRAAVEQVLIDGINPAILEIEDIVIESVDDGFVIGMTAYLYSPIDTEDQFAQREAIERIRSDLEDAVRAPVSMRTRIVPSTLGLFEQNGIEVDNLDS